MNKKLQFAIGICLLILPLIHLIYFKKSDNTTEQQNVPIQPPDLETLNKNFIQACYDGDLQKAKIIHNITPMTEPIMDACFYKNIKHKNFEFVEWLSNSIRMQLVHKEEILKENNWFLLREAYADRGKYNSTFATESYMNNNEKIINFVIDVMSKVYNEIDMKNQVDSILATHQFYTPEELDNTVKHSIWFVNETEVKGITRIFYNHDWKKILHRQADMLGRYLKLNKETSLIEYLENLIGEKFREPYYILDTVFYPVSFIYSLTVIDMT